MFKFLKRMLTTPASSSPAENELAAVQSDFLSPLSYREAESAIPTVVACADLLLNSVSSLPVRILRYEGTKAEVIDDHPILNLLREPAPHLNGFADLISVCMRSLIAYGNAIIIIDDATQKLVPIPWTYCSLNNVGSEDMRYSISRPYIGKSKIYTADQIIHLRTNISDDGGFSGRAPLARAFRAVGLAQTIEQATTASWANGCYPSIALKSNKTLNEKQATQARKDLRDSFTNNQHTNPCLLYTSPSPRD